MNIMKIIALFLGISTLFSCVSTNVPIEKPETTKSPTGEFQTTAKESWEIEWEKILEAARKEGEAVFYGSPTLGAVLNESRDIINQKYGLDISVVSSSGSEVNPKLGRERAAGLFIPDLLGSGLNTSAGRFKPSGFLDPIEPALILPEVTNPMLWYGAKFPWADKERRIVAFSHYVSPSLGINTELVKQGEIGSLYDLLSPKWIGKIIINDPTKTGSGFNSFSTLVYNKIVPMEFFKQLIEQKPVLSRHPILQADWLAKGKYAVLLWHESGPLYQYKIAGAPVANVVSIKEGNHLSSGSVLSMANKAPHPNAARVLINWILSKEGQTLIQKHSGRQSAREDISLEGIDQDQVRKPGEKYFMSTNAIEEFVLKEQDRYLELAREIFGPLIK